MSAKILDMPAESQQLSFTLSLLPPSVNHYAKHELRRDRKDGHAYVSHFKSEEAKAFERDFPMMLPAAARGAFVVGDRFMATFHIFPGPGDRGDVDNFNKSLLDCIAGAGMLRNRKGKELSDAWVKGLRVYIHDSEDDRKQGPKVDVTIETLPQFNWQGEK